MDHIILYIHLAARNTSQIACAHHIYNIINKRDDETRSQANIDLKFIVSPRFETSYDILDSGKKKHPSRRILLLFYYNLVAHLNTHLVHCNFWVFVLFKNTLYY